MRKPISFRWLGVLFFAGAMAGLTGNHGIHAQDQPAPAPNAENVAEGLRLYQQKADCRACHGWAADGRKSDNQMPDGPSLRHGHPIRKNRPAGTLWCRQLLTH